MSGRPILPRLGDLARLVAIAAWVVLALFVLEYLYSLGQDDGSDFADRLFGGMPELGTGIFYTGLLLGLAAWLSRERA